MTLTRERKIFGAVLVIAWAGLGYDQFTGGGAAAADAEDVDPDSLLLASSTVSTSPSSHKSTSAMNVGVDDISLASRLTSLAQRTPVRSAGEIRDAFRATDGWISKAAATTPAIGTVSPADQFAAEHKVSAISTNASGGGVAVIDGTMLHIGGQIDGYRLVALRGQHAIFEASDGARAQLSLPTDPVAPVAAAR
jgi:hypothetical protein